MPELWGRTVTKEELRRYCGRMEQIAGVRKFVYAQGKAAGLEGVEVRTGGGLRFIVLPGRGMDIGLAEFRGMPLSFMAPLGESAAQFFGSDEQGFVRNFSGGLLITCGLSQVGSPNEDEGQKLGQHGLISNIPAERVSCRAQWEREDYVMSVEGEVRETSLFEPNLLLRRRVWTRLGENRLFLEDQVVNESFYPAPLMLLYHINIGFPVLDQDSVLLAPSRAVEPRDEVAARTVESCRTYRQPTPDFPDTVYYHDMQADGDGWVQAALVNERLGTGVYVRYEQKNLPYFVQWKYTNLGNYVAALEPANCHVEGRARERERGTLSFLAPWEERNFRLEIGVLESEEAIRAFTDALH
ncbi:Protein of unknown function DUF4432 [Acididesulfobacillus acetoxydans]|uniref:Conserved domain protein n=1 Tax=Acididesulfobacillus acetoxydans TaxID=1561005 RepID=A0A8S0XAX0_9FIRM|nr:aldose 1-epimerase family protein [Acididesulfobacillus acetoxydans]CAA7600496.1 Protein of unknown function DUF4432 [Acididesulfobacillus acetoxydans]CEJ06630.1 Conserved domain protein [Acididesulfobacillus acetoxydans]